MIVEGIVIITSISDLNNWWPFMWIAPETVTSWINTRLSQSKIWIIESVRSWSLLQVEKTVIKGKRSLKHLILFRKAQLKFLCRFPLPDLSRLQDKAGRRLMQLGLKSPLQPTLLSENRFIRWWFQMSLHNSFAYFDCFLISIFCTQKPLLAYYIIALNFAATSIDVSARGR